MLIGVGDVTRTAAVLAAELEAPMATAVGVAIVVVIFLIRIFRLIIYATLNPTCSKIFKVQKA